MTKPLYRTGNYDLRSLDMAETVWLWRYRQPSELGHARGRHGMTREEAAEKLGLPVDVYNNLENGNKILAAAEDLARMNDWMADVIKTKEPTLTELCALARRRSGLSLQEVANRIGMSATTYIMVEARGDQRAVDHWRRQGYYFPGQPPIVFRITRPRASIRLTRPEA